MAGSLRQNTLLRQVIGGLARHAYHTASSGSKSLGVGSSKAFAGPYHLHRRAYQLGRDLPSDPAAQESLLKQLNRHGDSEAVIRAFESGRVITSEVSLGEYIKALVAVDRLDNSSLVRVLQRGAQAGYGAPHGGWGQGTFRAGASPAYGAAESMLPSMPTAAMAMGAQAASVVNRLNDLGTAKNPIVTMQAEPSARAQLWRTARMLLVAFMVVSGLGALVEERGLARGILNNPDLRPQLDSKTKFADVKGVDEAKAELEEVVHYLRDPHKYTTLGGKLPKGVLLVGPPGTGKTMLARAIAGEAGVPFFYCSGSEFEEMFVGVGARRVRDLFAAAKKAAPCIVFIDEIDAVGSSRNPKDQQYMKMTLNQLLVELDGFKPSEGVIVVAATNFPEALDKALVRPGRFDRHVAVPNPDVRGRTEILESHFRNVPRAQDVQLGVIARGTPGFSGADLANLVNLAALKAARDGAMAVSMAALEFARDRILMGAERRTAVRSDKSRRLTAYHESGHAIVAALTEGATPLHKATIVPRGMALGMVTQLPAEGADEYSMTRRELLARLDICMGGRCAEELIFGAADITTGASNDLMQASRLARDMVTKYGMSEHLGPTAVPYDDYSLPSMSSETRASVEAEVGKLLANAYERAQGLLKKHEGQLHALAAELLDKETLSGFEILDLLKKPPPSSVLPALPSVKTKTPAAHAPGNLGG